MWYVYILLCTDNSYYTGITKDVQRRFQTHIKGKGGAYTRSHVPIKILYEEEIPDKPSALKRELELKKLSRKEKSELINSKLSGS